MRRRWKGNPSRSTQRFTKGCIPVGLDSPGRMMDVGDLQIESQAVVPQEMQQGHRVRTTRERNDDFVAHMVGESTIEMLVKILERHW